MAKLGKGKINCLLGLTVTAFMAMCVFVFILLGPRYLFRKPDALRIGFLWRDNKLNQRLLHSASEAIRDIHTSIEAMDASNQVRPPMIEHDVGLGGGGKQDLVARFDSLYDAGFRTFFGLDDGDDLLQVIRHAAITKAENCSFVSPRATTADLAATTNSNSSSSSSNVALINFDDEVMADAFLRLIDHSNPTGKVLYVIPVVRSEEVSSLAFLEHLSARVKSFENLKLTSPVLYEASAYPKSDAFQIVSDIGSRLGLVPNAQILFVSSQELRHVIETAHVNRALRRRRWFAKDLELVEASLREDEKVRQYCHDVSLTTLSLLADDDGDWDSELVSTAFASVVKHDPQPRLSVYAEVSTYASLMLMHRAYTRSQYLGQQGGMLDSWAAEGPFEAEGLRRRRRSGILLANVFNGHAENVTGVPNTGWIPEREIRVRNRTDVIVSSIRSHPLLRDEIARLAHLRNIRIEENSNNNNNGSTPCKLVRVAVELPRSIYTPVSQNVLEIKDLPEMLLLPVKNGVRISLLCSGDSIIDDGGKISYYCLPKKFDRGNLTCMTAVLDEEDVRGVRPKRGVGNDTAKKGGGKKNDLMARTSLLLDAVKDVFGKTLPVWQDLLPNIFSCTSSVVGCDFCFYFLSTYNVSAYPASCVGGCSLGMFGSCSSLIGASIQETLDMFQEKKES